MTLSSRGGKNPQEKQKQQAYMKVCIFHATHYWRPTDPDTEASTEPLQQCTAIRSLRTNSTMLFTCDCQQMFVHFSLNVRITTERKTKKRHFCQICLEYISWGVIFGSPRLNITLSWNKLQLQVWLLTSGDFFTTARKARLPYNVWSNMYYCVNILLTKNAFEHVHLEDEFVQNQLHIAGQLTRFASHTFP